MIIGRLIGWILFFIGLAVLAHDAIRWHQNGHWKPILFGQLWYGISASSLNLAQVVVQRYLWPPLWDGAIVRLLLWWAFAVLMGAGIILVLVFHRRHDRTAPATPRPS